MPYATNKTFVTKRKPSKLYLAIRLIATICLWAVLVGGLIIVAALWEWFKIGG